MRIGIMGGEPLLHPHLKDILVNARSFFPGTILQLVTNGLLLLRQDLDFWRTCSENGIVIVNTKYPLNQDYAAMKRTADAHGVVFQHYGERGRMQKNPTKYRWTSQEAVTRQKTSGRAFMLISVPYLWKGRSTHVLWHPI